VNLYLSTVASGVAFGALYGLLGFAIVFLFKSTGVLNFAEGSIGMFVAFVAFELMRSGGMPTWAALLLTVPIAAVMGVLIYETCIRPRSESVPHETLTLRTIGIFVLVVAIANEAFSEGQPFPFPAVVPEFNLSVGFLVVSGLDLVRIFVAAALLIVTALFFYRTRYGMLYRAMADQPAVAQLLGVNVRALTAAAWGATGLIAGLVAVLTAPTTLLSTSMLDAFLPYALTAAVIGGFTSLFGVFVGGVIVGVINSLTGVYGTFDLAILAVFAVLVITLLFKPDGLFGARVGERL
jgi:branched-chain amino acid transport system permease protein